MSSFLASCSGSELFCATTASWTVWSIPWPWLGHPPPLCTVVGPVYDIDPAAARTATEPGGSELVLG